MHQQAKLPEIFDQIPKNTQVFWDLVPEHPPPKEMKFFPESKSDLIQNPPPKIENSNFLSRLQIWPYPEHPPGPVEVCGD